MKEDAIMVGASSLAQLRWERNTKWNITETSSQGEGIARIQGFVIFVANAKPRDHVKIKITRIGRRAANAEIVK